MQEGEKIITESFTAEYKSLLMGFFAGYGWCKDIRDWTICFMSECVFTSAMKFDTVFCNGELFDWHCCKQVKALVSQ